MITREQLADLQPGDVVEMRDEAWQGSVIRGPLVPSRWSGKGLALGVTSRRDEDFQIIVRKSNGEPSAWSRYRTLTVVSRAPRPLYVNHDRTEPVLGDVVRDADDNGDPTTFHFLPADPGLLEDPWVVPLARWEVLREKRSSLPDRLRLLVDGETGQAVTA